MRKNQVQKQHLKFTASVLFLSGFFIFSSFFCMAQDTQKLVVTKTVNLKYGAGGFDKKFSFGNMNFTLTHDGQNNPREEQRTFNYLSGAQKINTWYYNSGFQLDHFSSAYTNPSKIQAGAIEASYSGNKITAGYSYEIKNDLRVTSSYDLTTKKFIPGTVNYNDWGTYKPSLAPGPSLVFDKKNTFSYDLSSGQTYTASKPDQSFGKGTISIMAKRLLNFSDEVAKYYDARGILRKERYREYDEWGDVYEETYYYDCNSRLEHVTKEYYCGDCGETFDITEIHYKDGKAVAGYTEYEDEYTGDWISEEMDPDTGDFIDSYTDYGSYLYYFNTEPYMQATGPCDSIPDYLFKKQIFYVGPSLVIDNSGNDSYSLIGGRLTYQYNLCVHGGLFGNLEYVFKKEDPITYSQAGIYLGGAYAPFKGLTYANDFAITARAIIGVTRYADKYGSYKQSDTYPTIGGGVGLEYITNKGFFKGIGFFPYYRLALTKGDNLTAIDMAVQARF